jgi:adenine-specific DNA-methyltransferase
MEVFPDWDDGFEGCWTWGIDKAKAEINDLVGKKVNGNWKVYRKAYASTPGEEPTKQLKSIWSEKRHHTEKGQAAFNKLFDTKTKIFQSPKSLDVIMDAMAMTRDKDALILDFFAGSATAAHAMLAMNAKDGGKRRFVMVQLPEPCAEDSDAKKAGFATIADIGKERIRRVIKKLTSERLEKAKEEQGSLLKEAEDKPNLDLGLKVFKLDASNIKPWDADFDNLETALFDSIENIKPDRSEADVLYELLLKYGLDLAVPIEERKIAGKTVYIIGAGALIVCLDKKISLEVVEGIAGLKEELKPEVMRVVFKDAGFANDVVKTNAVQILRQAEIEDVKSL